MVSKTKEAGGEEEMSFEQIVELMAIAAALYIMAYHLTH